MSCFPRALVASLAVLAGAARASAQGTAPAQAPGSASPPPAAASPAAPAPAAPRPGVAAPTGSVPDGPRLAYTRGPAECLTEELFRREVAIAGDGADHFNADAPDVLRVWFEKLPNGDYRGTIEYTGADGHKEPPNAQTYSNCEVLGRFVGTSAYYYLPETEPLAPPPAPVPSSAPPADATAPPAAPRCPACAACGTSQPAIPRPISPKPPPWRMDVSVGVNTYVMMTAFLSANVGPAVGVGGEVRGEYFGVAAEFRFVVPSVTYAREPVPGATASFPQEFDLSQLSALLVPCAHYKWFVGCGVAQIGGLLMQTPIRLETSLSFGFGPRVGLEVPLGERFAVFGFGEVLFTPAPVFLDFTLPDPDKPGTPPANTRWEQSVASAFFGAGVSVKFR